jgi:hypothetical protein
MDDTDFDEGRIDIIGQNGNTGEHYDEAQRALLILNTAIQRTKWFENVFYTMNGKIPVDLAKERKDLEWLANQVEQEI